jgi:hypothetical protein
MIECPCCGQALLVDVGGDAQLGDEIGCSKCGHLWAVASLHPLSLVAVEEEQRHETD